MLRGRSRRVQPLTQHDILLLGIKKIKIMPKTIQNYHLSKRMACLGLVGLLLTPAVFPRLEQLAHAASCTTSADCRAQISNLSNANNSSQAQLSSLITQAGSYQAAVGALQTQISALQSQISGNQVTQANVASQIAAKQAELEQQKQTLADVVKAMYVDNQMSTIEMLATSKNLSDYVDKEEYRSAVQNQIQKTLTEIAALQDQLRAQQAQVDALLQSERNQQAQIEADKQQQNNLLAMNESQQSDFNAQIVSNKQALSTLNAQLAVLNTPKSSTLISSGTCGGGYPASAHGPSGTWGCNYAQDNVLDNWGMFNRECVSYTAFRVHQEYTEGLVAHDMPNWGGSGNAGEWIGNARAAGIPVDQTPHVGDIAIRPASGTAGDVGHAMYVEGVSSSSSITVSQYNASYTGTFSEVQRSTSGLYFLHFRQW